MNRNIYIPLSAALSLPIAEMTRDWMKVFAYTTVAGEQLAPYQYRVLFAYGWKPLADLLSVHVAAWLFWFLALSTFCLLIDMIIEDTAVKPDSGRQYLLAALVTIPGLIWFHPGGAVWSILEGAFIAGALLAILRGKTAVLYPLVVLATLNRETAILIPIMLFFMGSWKHTAGLTVVWSLTRLAILWFVGPAVTHLTLADIWSINTGPGSIYFLMGLPLFGWLFFLATKGWKNAPDGLRGAAVIVPVYLVLFGIFGIWYEWRWILALYPVLIPLAAVRVRKPRTHYQMGHNGWERIEEKEADNYAVPMWE